ncbi:hypothetical protein K402DRAFT_343978, partial [Aulographum hederae CBS 113979]
TRSRVNVARQVKQKVGIELLMHPAQSPNLNALEGVWDIIKQRLRSVAYEDIEQLKAIAQEAWQNITQEQIQARINEIPERIKILASGDGRRIRSKLW